MGNKWKKYKTDVLVVGGGGAAARAAISSTNAGANTLIAVKGQFGRCGSTAVAFGETTMYAAATFGADSKEAHFQDTITAGMGLCDENLVRILVDEAPSRFEELKQFGANFEYETDRSVYEMGFAHSFPRTFLVPTRHESELLRVLQNQVNKMNIPVLNNIMVIDLLLRNGHVMGAVGINTNTGEFVAFEAKTVVLACGGAHEIFLQSASSPEMTGDGYAMAYRAGADLVNMEFIQMGPASIFPYLKILSAPTWRLHPHLYNAHEEEFLGRYLPSEVDSSDVFAIAEFPYTTRTITKYLDIGIFSEIKEGRGTEHGGVYYDISHCIKKDILSKMPYTFKEFLSLGIDLSREKIEVGIAVQCFHGGVRINEKGETSIQGLFAAGETAGGVRGPERPGGNALAECQVFGHRAGGSAAKKALCMSHAPNIDKAINSWYEQKEFTSAWQGESPSAIKKKIQGIMWRNCLVVREKEGLETALKDLSYVCQKIVSSQTSKLSDLITCFEIQNMVALGKMVARASLLREETRGGHYRADFPQRDDTKWGKNIVVNKQGTKITSWFSK